MYLREITSRDEHWPDLVHIYSLKLRVINEAVTGTGVVLCAYKYYLIWNYIQIVKVLLKLFGMFAKAVILILSN